jgi:hypothetical protein
MFKSNLIKPKKVHKPKTTNTIHLINPPTLTTVKHKIFKNRRNINSIDPNLFRYRQEVTKYSEYIYYYYKGKINPKRLRRGKKFNHLDHKYSVYMGWKNGIF